MVQQTCESSTLPGSTGHACCETRPGPLDTQLVLIQALPKLPKSGVHQQGTCSRLRQALQEHTSQGWEGRGWQVKDAFPVGEQVCHLLTLFQARFQVLDCPQPLINLKTSACA